MNCFKARVDSEAHVAQLAEHVLGKDEVTGSIPVMGSRNVGSEKKFENKNEHNSKTLNQKNTL